ncbi:MAG: DUF3830 family protein [Clostridiales Family XIII bacterium]|jgi:hypothetical protein|nr:DUF3830 family protein [Clostridiales Family XIII bacterium]
MSEYFLEFEKGGRFKVRLKEAEAPNTVAAFKKALPMEGGCLQARFAGDEFFFNADVDVSAENAKEPYCGALSFNCDPKWKAVCVYYGSNIKSASYNLFAEITEDLEDLKKVGLRIWKQGEEKVVFKEV